MDNEKWEELDLRASSIIRISFAKNILANALGTLSAKEIWEKLKESYQGKGISNNLLLMEQFHSLHMDEHTKVSDHLSVLNGIVYELETIGVKCEDKLLQMIVLMKMNYKNVLMLKRMDQDSFQELVQ